MKYVSLFSGVGGFESALNKLGWECVFASEIDKYARQAYTVLYGNDHLHGDVTKINAKDVPDHDVLVGGFPCQAFSVAGKRKGFADTRGTLFFEIARIAEEKKPKLMLLENVKGLISHDKGNTLDTMMNALWELGYTVDFEVLNSKYFGVPQNRERIFIVAALGHPTEEWKIEGNTIVPKAKKRLATYENAKTFNFDWPTNDTVDVRLRDILETEVDEKYYLPQEKVDKLLAQLEETEGLPIKEATKKGYTIANDGDSVNIQFPGSITRRGRVGKQIANTLEASNIYQGVIQQVGNIDQDERKRKNPHTGRVYSPDGISPTINTAGGGNLEPKILEVRATLTPDRVNKRQNGRRFKENDEPMFTLTQQDIHGVAITNNKGNLKEKEKDISNNLDANYHKGMDKHGQRTHVLEKPKHIPGLDGVNNTLRTGGKGSLSVKHNYEHIHDGYRIRKLTPKECFRLQGFADWQFNLLQRIGISNTQLYKMAGNAVTVNVIEVLGKRMEGMK